MIEKVLLDYGIIIYWSPRVHSSVHTELARRELEKRVLLCSCHICERNCVNDGEFILINETEVVLEK